ncbi:MAG: ATP-binding protein [Bryobacteraceae bacterium]
MAEHGRGVTTSADRILASTLESVDRAEELVLDLLTRAGVEEEQLHQLGMAVRESMVNAVVHGNRYNPDKQVRLAVSVEPARVTIRISDQGEGFDPASLPNPLAPENLLRESGRGILLIQAFVDEFSVRRLQPAGVEVTLVKHLSPGS